MPLASPEAFSLDASSPDDALADPSVLFATPHGVLRWTGDGAVRLHVDTVAQTMSPGSLRSLQRSVRALARDVYRCEHGCRWQVRLPGGSVVFTSDEVLRLDTLLDGAVAMLDLYALLKTAGVDPAAESATA
jgi:hypothetical protein